MGEYLRQAYEERDLAKTLAKVHGIIDEETQKLSDKLHDLELSHNRKKKALQKILNFCSQCKVPPPDHQYIKEICESVLFCDGKVKGVF